MVNQDAFKWMQREKTIFEAAYKQVVPLRQKLEAKASQAGLQAKIIATQAKLLATREEVWCFQAKLETLRDSF